MSINVFKSFPWLLEKNFQINFKIDSLLKLSLLLTVIE